MDSDIPATAALMVQPPSPKLRRHCGRRSGHHNEGRPGAVTRACFQDVVVMDGSMGRLTMNMGVPEDPKLWSARGIIEQRYHGIVIDAHMQYINAGAVLITTNNYAVQPWYYQNAFENWEARMVQDTEVAASLAVQARKCCDAKGTVRVLGSLPPLRESHRPDLTESFIEQRGEAFVRDTYRRIAEALLRGGPVDAFILETMNTWQEARLAVEAVCDMGLPLFVCMEGALRNRSTLEPQPQMAVEYAANVLALKNNGVQIEGFGFNCAPPEETLASLEALVQSGMRDKLKAAGIGILASANCNEQQALKGGYEVLKSCNKPGHRVQMRSDLHDGYTSWCSRYMEQGVTHVGGCCGSTPEQIRCLTLAVR